MKKLLVLMVLGMLGVFLFANGAMASYFSPDSTNIFGMGFLGSASVGDLDSKTLLPNGAVAFVGDIFDGNPQFRYIEIGYTGLSLDFSAYTGYAMYFYNDNNQPWYVNLFLETATGGKYTLPAYTMLNTATSSIMPWESALYMNFASLGVTGLDNVISYGFQLAFNESLKTADGSAFQGDKYHMNVSSVPVPPSVLLLGSGLLGWVGVGTRRRFKKS